MLATTCSMAHSVVACKNANHVLEAVGTWMNQAEAHEWVIRNMPPQKLAHSIQVRARYIMFQVIMLPMTTKEAWV